MLIDAIAPGNAWFLVECRLRRNVIVFIVTDGDVWYPVRKVTKYRAQASSVYRHDQHFSVDLNKMTETDRQMVLLAIKKFTKNI